MDFNLTDDQRMLAETLGRYLAQRYPIERRHAAAASALGYDPDVWQGLVELGAVAALLPEAAGGLGGGGFDIMTVFEQAGRALVQEPLLGALLVGQALARADEPERWQGHWQRMHEGAVVALAHAEPDAHHARWSVATVAQHDPAGWVLDGHKAVVPFGAQAQGWLVSARVGGGVHERDGIALFWVPRSAPGVQRRDYRRIDGGRAAELVLRTVQLDAHALVVGPARGAEVLDAVLDAGALALSAEALGAMEVAFEHTRQYLQTRQQFGRPIGSFQALQHRMVDLWMGLEQTRSAVINAAAAWDGDDPIQRAWACAAAKASVGRHGTHLAEEAIQLHGGMGMTWELPLAHYAKRLVMIDHELGDEDHHLQRCIELMRQRAAASA
ncbi:MAG: acyl-CoA dehydrogenase family protein [Tepidimonas ignava]|uniref:Acryloyl-CoA reductase (NADH) n=1 Tax=Tepidimonas ignava TaxID=114249 RepID=A0A4V2UVT7_9BURK|nr:acyl-CoA dehydrogenase [Tepidimonas ignava]TCS97047.1 hypothetical protein EDC36_1117 [Tepidimonas ignava]TSE22281.1 Acryloyl-CoA reductase (NADH) [Tepidimonas ignava]